MKIGFIIVTYKTPETEIERLKKEISLIGFKNFRVYLIDNSLDNRGYSSGVNLGIKSGLREGVDVFIILNPDVCLKGLSAGLLLAGLKKFDILGGVIRQKKKTYYGGVIDQWRMSGGLRETRPKKRFIEVDFVSGSLMIIKKEVFKRIGLFDERYFMYYEDVEFCFRAKKAGFRIGIDKEMVYTHFELSQGSWEKDYFLAKNRLRFLLQHGGLKQKVYEIFKSPLTVFELVLLAGGRFFISEKRFLLNFFSMNTSSFLVKLFNFLLFLFLVRVLSVSDYGVYNLVWAHVNLFIPLVDLGTTSYGIITLPKNWRKRFNDFFSLRFFVSLLVVFLSVVFGVIAGYQWPIPFYIFLLSITIFSSAIGGGYLIITSVKEKVYLSSLVSLVFNGLLIFSLLIVLLVVKEVKGLFLTLFLSYFLYSISLYLLVNKEAKGIRLTVDFKRWKKILTNSYVFMIISFLAGFYTKIGIFVLNFLKGAKAVGVYSAGYKFLDGLMFLPGSYNVAVVPVLVRLFKTDKEKFFRKIKKDVVFLLGLGLLISFAFFVFAPLILPWFLKGEFKPSIEIARIVIFSLPFILLTSIFLNSLYAMGNFFIVVKLFAFQAIFNVFLNLLLVPYFSYYATAYITLFSEVVNLLLVLFFTRKELKNI